MATPAEPPLPTPEFSTHVVPLDGTDWLLAIDPDNSGRERGWAQGPVAEARSTQVPWVIQDAFPNYHGVAWYWRSFQAPANPHAAGRSLLRFHAVDYLGEVWMNGIYLGRHEGGEEPFVLDATAALNAQATNVLAVRVLNPTHEPIDGICLREVASGRRDYPQPRDNAYNTGGITGSVELLVAPVVRVADLYAVSDWQTGDIRVRATLRNAGTVSARARLTCTAAPAVGGETVASVVGEQTLSPGDTLVEIVVRVPHQRLWDLRDPFLYRVTCRAQADGSLSVDELSVRCGFRDFRFADGYFRLNGQRIHLHGSLYIVLQYPVTQTTPHDVDLVRRDIRNMKAMGFNAVRITCGAALPAYQLDLLDECGILVCEEHFGARAMAESPMLEERWNRSIAGVVRRDRNHPSIVMWSLLNEVKDGRLFRHVAASLPMLRTLDDSRVVLLGSGRFDNDAKLGSLSNPGSVTWESSLADVHDYPTFPHSAEAIHHMRTLENGRPLLLSEYGVCGAQDYPLYLRHFEQLGKEHAADASLYRAKLDLFLADWERWRLDQCWARPEDYFRESARTQATLALGDYNAWLANPALIGDFTSTQIVDAWFHGCGLTSYFRDLKPGMADAFTDMAAPVRWCLFVEPVNVYLGATVRLEAVLVNHDALLPGSYPVQFCVVGPGGIRALDTTLQVVVPAAEEAEPPFARNVFTHELPIEGLPGRYRFLATFLRGAAASGGEAEFYVGDEEAMPPVAAEVVLWGQDAELERWLTRRGLRVREGLAPEQMGREVILASGSGPGDATVLADLARHVARGSTLIVLVPEVLSEVLPTSASAVPLDWAPLLFLGDVQLAHTPDFYFRADHWAKDHPIFAGLPCGGILDYTFYRDILSSTVFRGVQAPVEAICGAIQTSGGPDDYESDLLVAMCQLGAGQVLLNSLKIRPNLGAVPAAERLLRNMLNYVAGNLEKPLVDLPPGFDEQLRLTK